MVQGKFKAYKIPQNKEILASIISVLSLDAWSKFIYIIMRVRSAFSLVASCVLL